MNPNGDHHATPPRLEKRPIRHSGATDRLPPHSPEAEQAVLGCIMDDAATAVPDCVEVFRGQSDPFYDLRHQEIYAVCLALYETKAPVNVISVMQWLKDHQKLEQIGGLDYLAQLQENALPGSSVATFAETVRDKSLLRRMIQACTGVVSDVYEHEGQVDEILDACERKILSISESRVALKSESMHNLVLGAIDRIEAAHQRGGAVSGLSTGFADFDKLTGGLQPGEMIVIAARPSVGKSSLAMNIADHVAVDLRLPVGVISLEMTAQSLVSRLLCSRARVNLANIRDGFLAERDFGKITGAAGKLKDAPLYIDDTRGLTVLQIRAKFRRWWQQHRIKLGIIDYLQLATAGGRWESRQQEVAAISCGVRNIAGELGIPILVLAQLNRDVEREKSRKPRLSDLRESGAIEADADLVGFLYRPEHDDDDESEACRVNLLIAKQRNGPTGDIPLTFLRQFTRFESASRIADEPPRDWANRGR